MVVTSYKHSSGGLDARKATSASDLVRPPPPHLLRKQKNDEMENRPKQLHGTSEGDPLLIYDLEIGSRRMLDMFHGDLKMNKFNEKETLRREAVKN